MTCQRLTKRKLSTDWDTKLLQLLRKTASECARLQASGAEAPLCPSHVTACRHGSARDKQRRAAQLWGLECCWMRRQWHLPWTYCTGQAVSLAQMPWQLLPAAWLLCMNTGCPNRLMSCRHQAHVHSMQHQTRHILDTDNRCYQVVPDCSAAAAHWRCTRPIESRADMLCRQSDPAASASCHQAGMTRECLDKHLTTLVFCWESHLPPSDRREADLAAGLSRDVQGMPVYAAHLAINAVL